MFRLRRSLFLVFFLSILAVSGPAFSARPQIKRCGTPPVDATTRQLVEQWLKAEKERRGPFLKIDRTVPVAFHVITSGRKGRVSDEQINVQIHNLNVAFEGTGFSFELVKVDRTNNANWYRNCLGRNEKAMKKRLAVDPRHVLNIYTCTPGDPDTLGIAQFPWDFPEPSFMHGVILHPISLPGSGDPDYGVYGLTTIHEIGHYFGLFHTFEGGCADEDEVGDTPAQRDPIYECRVGIDTCGSRPGLDDVQNFMNYADDNCIDHFTPGQADRMQAVVSVTKPSW